MNRLAILLQSIKNKFSRGTINHEPPNRLSVPANLFNVENERLRTLILTSAEITKISTQKISNQELIKQIVEILQNRLNLYFVGVYLIDKSREYAVLLYGSGDEGKQMLNASYRLVIGGFSLVGRAIKSKKTETAIIDESDPSRFENPFLINSKSEAVFPIKADDNILGVLNVHFHESLECEEHIKAVLQNTANVLALSFKNDALSQNNSLRDKIYTTSKITGHQTNLVSGKIKSSYQNPLFSAVKFQSLIKQIPLIFNDRSIGNLELETTEDTITDEQIEFVNDVTQQAIIHLQNILMIEEKQCEIDFEKTVLDTTSKIRSTNDPQKMLQYTLEDIAKNLNVSRLQIVLNVPESPPSVKPQNHDTQSLVKKAETGKLSKA